MPLSNISDCNIYIPDRFHLCGWGEFIEIRFVKVSKIVDKYNPGAERIDQLEHVNYLLDHTSHLLTPSASASKIERIGGRKE